MTRIWSLLLFSLCAGIILATPQSALADIASDIQAQIDANNQQLKELQAEIVSFQKQLNELGTKKDTLQSAITSLTLSQKQLASEVQATQNKIASANLKIRELTFSIGDKEELISADQDAIAKTLRRVAQDGETSLVVKLISSNTLHEAWQSADYAVQFNRALADDISELRAVRTELATNRDEVSATKAKLVARRPPLSQRSLSLSRNFNMYLTRAVSRRRARGYCGGRSPTSLSRNNSARPPLHSGSTSRERTTE